MIGNRDKPLIVVLGPTAVGKTGLALQFADALDGEIIGADSRQIYRYMDIGTAKPSPQAREEIPHHLIDVVDPDQELTLANYQRLAYDAIDSAHRRDRIPLLVGGTGQYITAVTEGWSIPEVPPNPALRDELEAYAEQHGKQALYQRLQRVDPTAAEKIHPNNMRRVIRALEVSIESGRPISELQQKQPPPYTILELGLELERHILYERADRRFDEMMARGLLDEVRRLLAMGYSRALPSMSGLGYAQLAAHLQGEASLEQAIYESKTATHDFIRRQLTWFRGHDRGILWHNIEYVKPETMIEACIAWLRAPS